MNGNLSHHGSSISPTRTELSPAPGSTGSTSQSGLHPNFQAQQGPTPSSILNAGSNNPLTMYLNQVSQQAQHEQESRQADPYSIAVLQQQQQQVLSAQQAALYGNVNGDLLNGSILEQLQPQQQQQQQHTSYSSGLNGVSSTATTIGGLLAPINARSQHARAVSLPAFSPEVFGNGYSQQGGQQQQQQSQQQQQQQQQAQSSQQHLQHPSLLSHRQQQSSFSGLSSGFGGFGTSGYGLALQPVHGTGLSGWAEEEVAQ